jgi:hypothetical protein
MAFALVLDLRKIRVWPKSFKFVVRGGPASFIRGGALGIIDRGKKVPC